MQEKKTDMLVLAIVLGWITFFCGLFGLIFCLFGFLFSSDPDAVKVGAVLTCVGIALLIIAVIALITATVLGILYINSKKS